MFLLIVIVFCFLREAFRSDTLLHIKHLPLTPTQSLVFVSQGFVVNFVSWVLPRSGPYLADFENRNHRYFAHLYFSVVVAVYNSAKIMSSEPPKFSRQPSSTNPPLPSSTPHVTDAPPLSQQPVLSKNPLLAKHQAHLPDGWKTARSSHRGGGGSSLSPASIRIPTLDEPFSNTQQVVDAANTDKFFTVTTKMKDMVNLLETASDDDKTLVLFEIQQVLEFARDFVLHNIFPVICSRVPHWNEAVQIPAAEALSAILTTSVPPNIAKSVCNVACNIIRTANDKGNRELWGEVLVRALPHGSWSGDELDSVVAHLQAGYEKFSITNKLTAKILGSMAISAVDHETKKLLMRRAIAMTEDEDPEVRGIIADSMGHIGGALSIREVELEQWASIQKLSHDDNARVHAAALRTIAVIVNAHKPKYPNSNLFRCLLPPLLYKECSNMRKAAAQDLRMIDEDSFLIVEINSNVFGKLLVSCYEFMQDESAKKEVYKAYQAMATCNSPVIRKNCALNIPEVALCLHEKFSLFLVDIIDFFSQDSDDQTRWTLASRLHEALKHLANRETISQLFRSVLLLLRDKNWLVRQNLMQNFHCLVAELSKYCTYNSSAKMTSLFEQLQLLCDGNWRVQELLVNQLRLAAPLVPPTSMTGKVLPLLYRISREGTFTVRKAAMGSIATSIRFLPNSAEREHEMNIFVEEWAHAPVYWMRIGFIEAAQTAVGLYSRCLFRDTFGMEVLKLAFDGVSNVRLRVAKLLPTIAPACYHMEEFQTAVEAVKKDGVSDVKEVAQTIEEDIEKSLQAGRAKFEDDMRLEDEERELYSRHLQNQKEANKKKNLKKAAGGWWSGKTKGVHSTPRGEEDMSSFSRKMSMPVKKSMSVNRVQEDSPMEEAHSADWEHSDGEVSFGSNALATSKDDSDLLKSSKSFRGLRRFNAGKAGNSFTKKPSMNRMKK